MSWWQFSLQCNAPELERVEALMLSLGAISISIGDAGNEPIFESLPGESPLWSNSTVSATFSAKADPEILYQQLAQGLPPRLGSSLRRRRLENRDWEAAYKQHFRPLECAPGLWIVPSWCQPPAPEAAMVKLDPGLAFGTGAHPTTALCLKWLGSQDLDGRRIIDYGCGSGILGIAAIKLGAARVLAVDIDPQALQASRDNFCNNQIDPAKIELCLPKDMPVFEADLLLANILAGPLQKLAPRFSGLLPPGGQILLSGILKTQLPDIQSTYRSLFDLDPAWIRDEWVSISGNRKNARHE